jgi:LPXTG-motif cell wall-anchored protein
MQLVSKSSWLSKFIAIAISIAMVLSFSSVGTALAANDDNQNKSDDITITITNATKGEKYNIYKLFDATYSTTTNSIAYQLPDGVSQIPGELTNYFQVDTAGNVELKDTVQVKTTESGKTYVDPDSELAIALNAWASSATEARVNSEDLESGGSAIVFTVDDYGYYVVTSSQGAKLISVDSTSPNAIIYDKNSSDYSGTFEKQLVDADGKELDNKNVSIGDIVYFKISFTASNYDGKGESAKQIVKYSVKDIIPDGLDKEEYKFQVISVKVGDETLNNLSFNNDGMIDITWASGSTTEGYTSLYNNGVKVEIIYSAKVTADILNGGSINNKANLIKTYADMNTSNVTEIEDDDTAVTSAVAIQKHDANDNSIKLTGAKFKIKGLKAKKLDDGVYQVVSYSNSEDAAFSGDADGNDYEVSSIEGSKGQILIVGIAANTILYVKETVAPNGYNLASDAKTVNVEALSDEQYEELLSSDENSESSTDKTLATADYGISLKNGKYSSDYIEVLNFENNQGITLPSTGGMGTTILYVIGGLLIVCAGGALYIRRRNQA